MCREQSTAITHNLIRVMCHLWKIPHTRLEWRLQATAHLITEENSLKHPSWSANEESL